MQESLCNANWAPATAEIIIAKDSSFSQIIIMDILLLIFLLVFSSGF